MWADVRLCGAALAAEAAKIAAAGALLEDQAARLPEHATSFGMEGAPAVATAMAAASMNRGINATCT